MTRGCERLLGDGYHWLRNGCGHRYFEWLTLGHVTRRWQISFLISSPSFYQNNFSSVLDRVEEWRFTSISLSLEIHCSFPPTFVLYLAVRMKWVSFNSFLFSMVLKYFSFFLIKWIFKFIPCLNSSINLNECHIPLEQRNLSSHMFFIQMT